MITKNLLLELITEDLPYKDSHILIICFVKNFVSQISKINFTYTKVEWELTHRRIVIKIYNIQYKINKQKSYTNAYKHKSISSCLKSCLNEILINTIIKCNSLKKGMILHEELNKQIKFIRPIKNLLVLLNHQLIKIQLLNLKSTKFTYSHQFIKLNLKIKIDNFNQYEHILYHHGKVIINYKSRKEILLNQLKELENIKNIHIDYESLIEEILFFKEWPVLLQSSFNSKFLDLPQELIIYIIKNKQKCFPVYSKDKTVILPIFFTVINIPINSYNEDRIRKNYSNIVNNFLTEIEFFFLKDRKKRLSNYLEDLKSICLEVKLGNLFDKTQRIKKLLFWLSNKFTLNKDKANKLAILSKCDLATLLVQEYPELRGVIGMCYSNLDNEDNEVSNALKAQYLPFKYPYNNKPIFCFLSLVDLIDDIVGLISIHFKDNKIYLEQDPYEIRRKTRALIKIILYYNLNIDVFELIKQANIAYTNINDFGPIESLKIMNFIYLKYISFEKKYFTNHLLIKAVTNIYDNKHNIFLLHKRIELLHKYFNTPYLNKIIEIYKRINNLVYKLDLYKFNNIEINTKLISNPFEHTLCKVILFCKYLFTNNDYDDKEILLHLYKLSIYMEKFINNIKIFIDNEVLSNHRILLTITVKNLILKLADINLII